MTRCQGARQCDKEAGEVSSLLSLEQLSGCFPLWAASEFRQPCLFPRYDRREGNKDDVRWVHDPALDWYSSGSRVPFNLAAHRSEAAPPVTATLGLPPRVPKVSGFNPQPG